MPAHFLYIRLDKAKYKGMSARDREGDENHISYISPKYGATSGYEDLTRRKNFIFN